MTPLNCLRVGFVQLEAWAFESECSGSAGKQPRSGSDRVASAALTVPWRHWMLAAICPSWRCIVQQSWVPGHNPAAGDEMLARSDRVEKAVSSK